MPNDENGILSKYLFIWTAEIEGQKQERIEVFDDFSSANSSKEELPRFFAAIGINFKNLKSSVVASEDFLGFVENGDIKISQKEIENVLKILKIGDGENEDYFETQAWISSTEFRNAESNVISYGVIGGAGEFNGFDNNFSDMPTNDLELLQSLVEESTTSIINVLQFVKQNKTNLKINKTIFTWEEIEEIMKDL